MSITFNADEIFEMAEEIERNGVRFYRKASNYATDPGVKKMLLGMATMEDGHERTFAEMREQLSDAEKEPNTFDPQDEAAMYLQTMADSHGTEGKKSMDEELTGDESAEEVFKIATRAEADSIAFYVGLKEMVSEKAGRDKIDDIIKEEIGHLAILNKKLIELRG